MVARLGVSQFSLWAAGEGGRVLSESGQMPAGSTPWASEQELSRPGLRFLSASCVTLSKSLSVSEPQPAPPCRRVRLTATPQVSRLGEVTARVGGMRPGTQEVLLGVTVAAPATLVWGQSIGRGLESSATILTLKVTTCAAAPRKPEAHFCLYQGVQLPLPSSQQRAAGTQRRCQVQTQNRALHRLTLAFEKHQNASVAILPWLP